MGKRNRTKLHPIPLSETRMYKLAYKHMNYDHATPQAPRHPIDLAGYTEEEILEASGVAFSLVSSIISQVNEMDESIRYVALFGFLQVVTLQHRLNWGDEYARTAVAVALGDEDSGKLDALYYELEPESD